MNMKLTNLPLVWAVLGGMMCADAFAAKIYTCEIDGQTVYTSRPSASCHSADLPSIGRYSSAPYHEPQVQPVREEPVSAPKPAAKKTVAKKPSAKPAAPTVAKAQPAPVAAAPVVSSAPKSGGSSNRKTILQQELANERKALSDTQKSLAQARAAKGGSINQEQITQLQSSVLDRQQNIQALQRELGRM